jgi:hypothetical protein
LAASSEQPVVSFQSLAIAVGQNKHPLALVRRAAFRRAEYAPRDFITQLFQIADDAGESQRDVPFNVLEEADSGPEKSNACCNGWPEVARVIGAESFACGAEWLAGITSREDVHAARKRCPRE